ncbi:uncharacterized protein CDAR_603371 [Caerostris darwini]|uniref:Uncharacterized protein n=1 Tax=Caerostris darwini TaxID=1538125 RepID=A0AAV4SJT3_9ARAC|nr:uncharacterized protein CDAR_603371 [Caerostris darwini]
MLLQILDEIGSSRLLTYMIRVCLASLQNLTDHVSKKDISLHNLCGLSTRPLLVWHQNRFRGKLKGVKGNGSKINLFPADDPRRPSMSLNLNLKHNLLPSVGAALRCGQATHFSMADNLVGRLGPQDFQDVLRLRHLNLQGNVIAQVERLTFANVRKDLRFLDLSRNRMEFLQGCLQNFTSLKTLNLSHNRIEGFTPGEFYNMNRLTELHLEGNRITTLVLKFTP